MFATVARIVRAVDVPVPADVESGYGLDPKELVARLLETGAVGCNLEDARPWPRRGTSWSGWAPPRPPVEDDVHLRTMSTG